MTGAKMFNSILDTDLYKLTMQQAVMQKFPYAMARFEFINRGNHKFTKKMVDEIIEMVHDMADLKLESHRARWLSKKCPFLNPVYISFLKGYRFDCSEVKFAYTQESKTKVKNFNVIVEGYWFRTILWEVFLMAIISEVYMRHTYPNAKFDLVRDAEKFKALEEGNVRFADFGTRRRFSSSNQERIVTMASSNPNFIGTSNVYLACEYNLKPIGTHAHEWFMFHGAKYGYKEANRIALRNWADVYHGNLGVALSDTYGSESFFKSFGSKYARLFDGVRHDSGNPIRFATRVIAHYQSLGIDPTTKTIVFSDSINSVDDAVKIVEHCKGKIRCSLGIGGWFTSDIPETKRMNMVIKMTACKPYGEDEWQPTVKLSDVPGKHTGEESEIQLCKASLRI